MSQTELIVKINIKQDKRARGEGQRNLRKWKVGRKKSEGRRRGRQQEQRETEGIEEWERGRGRKHVE